ncbi:MAG: extracellular solute-binding protein [Clostridia bacterium]|nr:extracellular solute-binding protein [Clostridia bacterium]
MKKFSIYLLIAAMLTQLAACGTPTGNDETQKQDESAAETTETTRIWHQLPEELDFGGETFNAAFFGGEGTNKNYLLDESSSDNMEAAVYRRTKKTEDFLGTKITYSTSVTADDYTMLYKSGDDLYQLLFYPDAYSFTTEGYLYNLDTLPYVDFSAEWWNAEQMDALRLGKYHYFIVNDFTITSPSAMLFNRDMITDNNLEDPYELVLSGKWTLDKFAELGKGVINDMNGDGDYYGVDDINSFFAYGIHDAIPFFAAGGQFQTGRDEYGMLELVLNSEKTLALYDMLSVLGNTPGFSHLSYNHNVKDDGFATGTALFRMGRPETMATVTEYDFNTGILPMPKYNEEQEEYMCYDWSSQTGVSGTTKNPELVGAVLEFLAWDSKNEVFPTYYDVLLKTRYSSDMETREMMNIIFDSLVFEVGGVYFGMQPGFCELWYLPCNPLFLGSDHFAASYRAYKNPAKNTINSYYEALAKIEGPLVEEETTAE